MWLSNVAERENAPTEYPYEKKDFNPSFRNHDNCHHGHPEVTNYSQTGQMDGLEFVSFRLSREKTRFSRRLRRFRRARDERDGAWNERTHALRLRVRVKKSLSPSRVHARREHSFAVRSFPPLLSDYLVIKNPTRKFSFSSSHF